ncbi:MAG: hypothetical protein JWL83_1337 [Actinomycetia bacterium]|nr:hypothetical protein [Actinomycetes bacterium]
MAALTIGQTTPSASGATTWRSIGSGTARGNTGDVPLASSDTYTAPSFSRIRVTASGSYKTARVSLSFFCVNATGGTTSNSHDAPRTLPYVTVYKRPTGMTKCNVDVGVFGDGFGSVNVKVEQS